MADKSNGKTPQLIQSVRIQRSPFVSPAVDARPEVNIALRADLTREYVPAGTIGYMPFLRAQPQYIDDLTQSFGLDVYSQMLKDPVVYASERVYNLAILANGWEIIPSLPVTDPDYPTALKYCEFVKENIENLETAYDVILEQHLNAFEYGCSVSEQIYKVEGGLIRLADLREKPLQNAVFVVDSYNNTVGILTQRFPGQIFPANSYIPIDFAMANNANRDGVKDERNARGELDLSQRIPGFLPRNLFSVLTNEMRYNDERGHSGLRAAYSAWWFKQQTIAEYLAWLSRFASPSLVGTTAQGAVGEKILDEDLNPVLDVDGSPLTKTPEEVLSEAMAAFANGSALAIPFGATVEPIQPTGDGAGFAKAINWANSEIVRGITFQFLATSEGEHQSRASSDTHQDILSLGIMRRKLWLANQQRREVFYPLLRYNFDLSGRKIKKFVPKLNLGSGAGFPLSTAQLAEYARAVPLDPSQYAALDAQQGVPPRTIQFVGGVPMTPTEMMKQQREDTQRKQEQDMQMAQRGQMGGQGGGIEEG